MARKILIEVGLGVILINLVPWSAEFFLAATPIFFSPAARAEQVQKVSRWDELRHLAVRDPLAWIRRRVESGTSVVVVSHALEPFLDLASRTITVKKGRVLTYDALPESPDEKLTTLDLIAKG